MLTYLAIPYSHPRPEIRQQRYEIVNEVAAQLMREGHLIYSPISHSHPIAVAHSLPTGWEFWHRLDREVLSHCGKLIVLKLDGWEESQGVMGELSIAEELGIPVEFMEWVN